MRKTLSGVRPSDRAASSSETGRPTAQRGRGDQENVWIGRQGQREESASVAVDLREAFHAERVLAPAGGALAVRARRGARARRRSSGSRAAASARRPRPGARAGRIRRRATPAAVPTQKRDGDDARDEQSRVEHEPERRSELNGRASLARRRRARGRRGRQAAGARPRRRPTPSPRARLRAGGRVPRPRLPARALIGCSRPRSAAARAGGRSRPSRPRLISGPLIAPSCGQAGPRSHTSDRAGYSAPPGPRAMNRCAQRREQEVDEALRRGRLLRRRDDADAGAVDERTGVALAEERVLHRACPVSGRAGCAGSSG